MELTKSEVATLKLLRNRRGNKSTTITILGEVWIKLFVNGIFYAVVAIVFAAWQLPWIGGLIIAYAFGAWSFRIRQAIWIAAFQPVYDAIINWERVDELIQENDLPDPRF